MIRPLRRTHRIASVVLAVVLPIGLALALAARVDVPAEASLDEGSDPDASARHLGTRFGDLEIELTIRTAGGRPSITLAPTTDPKIPDLLAYWQAEASEELSPAAHLLGSLAGAQPRTLDLPREATTRAGTLVLYSLARREVVAIEALDASADAGGN